MPSERTRPRHKRTTHTSHKPLPCVEELERRCLLALVLEPSLNALGALSVFLDDASDAVHFGYADAQTVRLTVNGVAFDYNRNAVRYLTLVAGGGDDQLTIASDVSITTDIYGDAGNDSIIGGGGVDLVSGDAGNDTLIGNAGNDILDGSDRGSCTVGPNDSEICGPHFSAVEADSILGGDGDDTILADAGTDTVDGGAGTNTILWSTYAGCVSANTADDPSQPQESGPDNILFEFINATTARVTVNGTSFDYPRQNVTCFEAQTGAGDDRVEVAASVTVPATILGGDGNDTIIGSSGNDSLDGGDGNDSILGNAGNDTLMGGNGNDYLAGGPGDDYIDGGPGDDTLVDGMGNDTLIGGGGNDLYILTPGSDDVLSDSGGSDAINFAGAFQAIRFDLSRDGGQRQVVDDHRNTVALNGVFENLVGSRFGDDLTGNAMPNLIDGGGGDDTLDGSGGDRSLFGGLGLTADRRAGTGCDGDTLVGGAGNDWLDGGRGGDSLDGGNGDDVLVGDATRDVLRGGAGNNRTVGVLKNPSSCGGLLAARIAVLNAGASFDAATGQLYVSGDMQGPSDDVILVSLSADDFVVVSINGTVQSADPNSPNFDPSLTGATGSAVVSILVQGNDGNDQLVLGDGFVAASGQVTLDGGPGNDRITASAASEHLLGGPGNDTLAGGAGDDWLVGGNGNDTFEGGGGNDTADFGGSARAVRVNLSRGTARGQGTDALAAVENVVGSMFNDQIVGDSLANILLGGDGNDVIRGGDGNDLIDGGAGNDQLFGDLGNDILDGSSGNDLVHGGAGDDQVAGSAGVDQLFGDEGFDQVMADLLDKTKSFGRDGGTLVLS